MSVYFDAWLLFVTGAPRPRKCRQGTLCVVVVALHVLHIITSHMQDCVFGVISLIWLTLALVDSEEPAAIHVESRDKFHCTERAGGFGTSAGTGGLCYRLQYLNLQHQLDKAIADGLFFQFSELVEDQRVCARNGQGPY